MAFFAVIFTSSVDVRVLFVTACSCMQVRLLGTAPGTFLEPYLFDIPEMFTVLAFHEKQI
jgi:hypothetical protein